MWEPGRHDVPDHGRAAGLRLGGAPGGCGGLAGMPSPITVALLGCGSVGSQVVRLLQEQRDDLAARVGAPLDLVGVAVRRPDAKRDVPVPAHLLTTDAAGLVASGVDV